MDDRTNDVFTLAGRLDENVKFVFDKSPIQCYYIVVVSNTAYQSYKIDKERLSWKT